MTEEQRERLSKLKEKNNAFALEQRWKKNTMLQNCLKNLTGDWNFAATEIGVRCSHVIASTINMGNPPKKLNKIGEISSNLLGSTVYIVWEEATLPVVHCDFKAVMRVIQNVISVDFDTWILSENMKKMIHFSHNNEIEIFCVNY